MALDVDQLLQVVELAIHLKDADVLAIPAHSTGITVCITVRTASH